MTNNKPWIATHYVTLHDPASGEILRDTDSGDVDSGEPDSGELLYNVPVMMIDNSKAYQEREWEPGVQMGDPDIMRDPLAPQLGGDLTGGWTYKVGPVLAKFEPV
jgi:hypothetical protein